MVRQLFAHLVREELRLLLVADCTTVADGTAALLREKPDLAIVDWMLPDGRHWVAAHCGCRNDPAQHAVCGSITDRTSSNIDRRRAWHAFAAPTHRSRDF